MPRSFSCIKTTLTCLALLCTTLVLAQPRTDSLKQELTKELPDTLRSKILYQLAKDLYRVEPKPSLEYARESLKRIQPYAEQHPRSLAMSYNILGVINKNEGEYDSALVFYVKAIELFEEINDSVSLAPVFNDVGVLFKTMGEYEKALPYYRKAYQTCVRIKNANGTIMTLNNVGTIHNELGDIDSTKWYYFKAYRIADSLDNWNALAIVTNNIGELFSNQGDERTALRYFKETLRYDQKSHDDFGMSYSLLNIANVFMAMGESDSALVYLDTTLALVNRLGARNIRQGVYYAYSWTYEETEQYDSALKYHKLFTQLKDSIMNQAKIESLQELKVKYETEKSEHELAEVKTKQAEAMLAITKQRTWIFILMALVLFSLLLAWFLVERRKKKAQAAISEQEIRFQKKMLDSTILVQEQERQRIAKDLHDGLVQQLAVIKMNLQSWSRKLVLNENDAGELNKRIVLLDEAADEARMLSHQMMPRALMESGLIDALEDMLEKNLTARQIDYSFEHFGLDGLTLKKSIEIGLYRISQEMVNNIVKHSKAKRVDIQLYKTKAYLILHIEDDGIGFKVEDKRKQSGIGLNNIFSRASAVNGEVNYEPRDGKGTTASVRIPLESLQ
mgnify:CR=1 FL=1